MPRTKHRWKILDTRVVPGEAAAVERQERFVREYQHHDGAVQIRRKRSHVRAFGAVINLWVVVVRQEAGRLVSQ